MLLKAEGLCKAFDNINVLQDITFEVNAGEVVSLVGKSGAGKTTVLRCITGLEKCDKGSIEINGKYICSMENGIIKRATKEQLFEVRKDLGMVFQNYHLFPHLTVAENVTLALTEVYKMPKQDALLKAKEMLGMRLCVLHNLYFYNHLMEEIREAIEQGRYQEYKRMKLEGFCQK